MSSFFRLVIDEEALTDALFEYVVDPCAGGNEQAVIRELQDVAPEIVEVMESMAIDGVDRRVYVADYLHYVATHPAG